MIWWWRFLRFWHTIDLDGALWVGNWRSVTYEREAIAALDAKIDVERLLK